MNGVKDMVIRQFGDKGAETFEKHWAQIQYTVYLCSFMLSPTSGIIGIIPEGIEDVCVVRENFLELHQVKCRDETQPPWTTAEILPILCKLYHHRLAFTKPCQYHFVSDFAADSKTQFRPGYSYGALTRLKQMLDIKHDGYQYTDEELVEFSEIENVLVNKIVKSLIEQHNDYVDFSLAREFLGNTWIKTGSKNVRNHFNYEEFAELVCLAFPGQSILSLPQLQDYFIRILFLVVEKIITEGTIDGRTIHRDEILECKTNVVYIEAELPNLDRLPGSNYAEKKAFYGGFDITELPVFAKQRLRANIKQRKLEALGFEDQITDLALYLITLQRNYRREISNQSTVREIGPEILRCLEAEFPLCVNNYFPNHEVDEIFCHGLIWQATNECHLWWHRLGEVKGAGNAISPSIE